MGVSLVLRRRRDLRQTGRSPHRFCARGQRNELRPGLSSLSARCPNPHPQTTRRGEATGAKRARGGGHHPLAEFGRHEDDRQALFAGHHRRGLPTSRASPLAAHHGAHRRAPAHRSFCADR